MVFILLISVVVPLALDAGILISSQGSLSDAMNNAALAAEADHLDNPITYTSMVDASLTEPVFTLLSFQVRGKKIVATGEMMVSVPWLGNVPVKATEG
jgi:Flp pilus assembly protein TadG